ncbi:MAG: FHA domain-containing protein [Candidatus Aminicenantes bacterium]|nr:FHA domain-containing protein [Candidatus Aminicenantes bacterium]
MRIFYETEGKGPGEFTSDSDVVIIGRLRSQQSDYLGLKDGKVSAHHARITVEDGDYWIEDLGSTNGTWFDKKKISVKTRLLPGAPVRIGGTTLTVETALSPSLPSSASDKATPPEGKPVEVVKANDPLPDLLLDKGSPKIARHRLSVFCELTSTLGDVENLEMLASLVLTHIHKAFPRKGRDMHSGLLLGDDLMLKAYYPENKPPTCSFSLARYVQTKKKACLWHVSAQDEVAKSASLFQYKIQSAMYAPLIWKNEILGVIYVDVSSPKQTFEKEDLRFMQAIATHAAMFIKNLSLHQALQREEVIKARLLSQFPRPIAERLAHNPSQMAYSSERMDQVTVLFSDVRGFTKLSAQMEPDLVVKMLNDMFHDLTPIVIKHNGTVDKYVGDAILAVFGCPEPDKQQWENAIKAALEMQEAILELQSTRWKNCPVYKIGIGIHSGPVIHGFIGARERMEYTVIGNTINIASRYCDGAGSGEILISPVVYQRLHQKLDVEHPAREIETKHEGKFKAYLVRHWKEKTG